jgi:hypothetical protein
MGSTRVSLENFDCYDRFLLWTALKSGHLYVKVKKGAQGYWVSDLPGDEPGALGMSSGPNAQLMRLDEIDGLTRSSRQPFVDPGPWLQAIWYGLMMPDRTQHPDEERQQ